MMKYRLYDRYENYGFIGGFDSVKALVDVAQAWVKGTGGKCDLRAYILDDTTNDYRPMFTVDFENECDFEEVNK